MQIKKMKLDFDKVDVVMLKKMYAATAVGAGGSGVLHFFAPAFFGLFGAPPAASFMHADGFIAAVFLAFAFVSALAILGRNEKTFTPVIFMQGIHKTLWCLFFIVTLFSGATPLSFWNVLYFSIMATFMVGGRIDI